MNNTLVGLFDKPNAAQSAVQDLVNAGFDRNETRLMSTVSESGVSELVGLGLPKEHAAMYAQAVKVGGTLVVVTADASKAQQAHAIMDRDGAIEPSMGAAATATAAEPATTGTNKLEVVEETLQVGKREVETGGMRVRSFVTEKAVSQQVNLREEHVDVTRTKVDRPATEADFRAGTIEMRETAEVAVVAKEARVVEEISLGKTASEHTETVNDTVRRTDYKVEHIGDAGALPSNADLDAEFRTYLKGANPSASYERYAPAFAYGRQLADDPSTGGAGRGANEASYRSRWESRNPGTWSEFQASVKHAYDAVKNKASLR